MAVENDADRATFFSTAEFATAATWRDSENFFDARTVNGIFENAYVVVAGVESRRPVFRCAEGDLPVLKHNDELDIDGSTYTIVEPRPDGVGTVLLILEKQDAAA